jgi:ATP/maltotriose-dependent transcriptional regulator MalT
LLAEMWLVARQLDQAAAALDLADHYLNIYDQRATEGLILLIRARLLHARGEPVAVVRAAVERARALSVEREAHLFAHRTDEFLATVQPSSM